MGKQQDHWIVDEDSKHVSKEGTEGGACLTGHDKATHQNFGRKHTCNFRYQGVEQARDNKDIKKYLHSYNKLLAHIADEGVTTSVYPTSSGGMFPAYYCTKIPKPRKGDWDVDGPTQGDIERKNTKGKKATVKQGKNFTKATWPYWNQAHHLITKSTFKNAITSEPADVAQFIEKGLLEAKYNINHKRNMLMMPMDKEVGEILDMPRHIQLMEGDAPELKAECQNHPVYNKMVDEIDDGLEDIIVNYRDIIENATEEECKAPDFKLDKTRLEDLSDMLLEMILKSEGGRSLDKIAKLNTAGNRE
ncbi:AHH domain-containing protein [Agarilytica rhodophyticola]|uniref:AHH domain-containing protein n=1 Tax=Agarilytica rhodophyticola TaxID=1737490 RepID=UPI000B344DDB|nr:AHH domain-containing protein [Agarilytica rhodophyticola]